MPKKIEVENLYPDNDCIIVTTKDGTRITVSRNDKDVVYVSVQNKGINWEYILGKKS